MMKFSIPIVLFLFAIPGCRDKPLSPTEGAMPLNNGSVVRYRAWPKEMAAAYIIRWKEGGVFVKPSERVRPLVEPTCDVFNAFIEEAVSRGAASREDPFAASAVVVSLDPDLVVLCIWHTPGDIRPIPFDRWSRKLTNEEGGRGVGYIGAINSPRNIGWYVGAVAQNTKHVILINSDGDARELHFDAVGDSIDVFSDEEVTIQFTRVSKHTIRCFRIEKGEEGTGDALDKSLAIPKTEPRPERGATPESLN